MSLQFVEVDKTFGRTQVLKKVSFSVGHGEIVGLLGPNGSGKTPPMRMAAASNSPETGLVKVRVGQETLSR
ncbi:ATP-binding cassette domain-containing protein, partial [Myxococcota bacterium]|nr:ATP-binding cassette domain-containing protein [Myxococcota bacterium]